MRYFKNTKWPTVGDKITLSKDVSDDNNTLKKGTKVVVVGEGHNGYDVRDYNGVTVYQCGWAI